MKHNLYYMAPPANVRSIATHGILAFNLLRQNPRIASGSSSIADPFVNARRERLVLSGKSVHDYVPLYWATHTPMQYVRTMKPGGLSPGKLVCFVMDADELLALPGVLTTDGNAASDETQFYHGAGALAAIDWTIVATSNCFSKEYKRKKCAEVLVPDCIARSYFRAICCYDEAALVLVRWELIASDDAEVQRMAQSSTTQVARGLHY